ncbi:MAG: protein-L-isoaspartate(D-aspartate) O-methyltransferase [Saprospiraceae bacterium]|jgi:protein-L-isoaspartate(D-aspartate) O-methyltransferase|uniref:protein-L-isoaspartate(D-aspartate) O-methyltransferase n=1 Tax=Candidatus Brachybacter algidus TaxID=2982024 RepID=UPI001ED4ACB2|nr:protein-L-isoaspartate(D-aspartate) O-methyltransferase [Candidatus Brachybacter algidus]MBK7604085.1 protein-L-isoaspartate(D-aspartate) O-methyltransferase [Candidatus Brachybacter algidus]MBL0118631.1 protein-L-isoaspartate(D-aspartate) O-methyltransferase [Candidatus Brachybacter algidus]
MYKNSIFVDDYRHKGLRKKLIETLKSKGIRNEAILNAFQHVPRHFFLDKAFEEMAYKDQPFPIGFSQTISQPYTVAYQTQLLDVKKRDKILEIGTGSGFQSCILSHLGARVYTIERQEGLYHKTNILLEKLGFGAVKTYLKDGFKGLPVFAPFDKILITAAPDELPYDLIDQLKIGGIMVLPKGNLQVQKMLLLTKTSETSYKIEEKESALFVPMLSGIANHQSDSNY